MIRTTIQHPDLDAPVHSQWPDDIDLRTVFALAVRQLGRNAIMHTVRIAPGLVVSDHATWTVGRRGRYVATPLVDPRAKA